MAQTLNTLQEDIGRITDKLNNIMTRLEYLENIANGYHVCKKCKRVLCKREGCCVYHVCDCTKNVAYTFWNGITPKSPQHTNENSEQNNDIVLNDCIMFEV